MWNSNSAACVSGKYAAWVEHRGSGHDLWVENLVTGAKNSVFAGMAYAPAYLDISGTRLAWVNAADNTLHSYEFASDTYTTLSGFTSMPRELDLSGNVAVWEDYRNKVGGYHLDLYGYDFGAGQEIEITNDHANDFAPAVSGHRVVWRSYDNGDSKIEGYNLATQQRFVVTDSVVSPNAVGIDGNLVAWNGDYTTWDHDAIWAKSLIGGDPFLITHFNYTTYSVAVTGDVVTWDAGPYVQAARIKGAECYVARGGFEQPDAMSHWNVTGSAAVVTDPHDPANSVLELTTASPVTIGQSVSTPDLGFSIDFDYEFLTTDGWLEVYLNGELVRTISAPPTPVGDATFGQVAVWHSRFMGLRNVELALVFDSPLGGQQLHLDNIGITTGVPEPLTGALMVLGGLAAARRQRC